MHAEAIKQEFLFCETTKAIDISEIVDRFFANQSFDWKENLGAVCICDAWQHQVFAVLVKKEATRVNVHHLMRRHQRLFQQFWRNILRNCQFCQRKVCEPFHFQEAVSGNGSRIWSSLPYRCVRTSVEQPSNLNKLNNGKHTTILVIDLF